MQLADGGSDLFRLGFIALVTTAIILSLRGKPAAAGEEKVEHFCGPCGRRVRVGPKPYELMHGFLALVTCGLWVVVWILKERQYRASLVCPKCGSLDLVQKAPDGDLGRRAPAPALPASPVPVGRASATRFRFACACGEGIWAKVEHVGKQAKCPKCAAVVTIPPQNG